MTQPYDLTQLDTHSFEHLVNFIALKVLGNGITGFAAGADGGRDGFLLGKADYPTSADSWEGTWYIQSKFHKPNLSSNAQHWLIREVIKEIKVYENNPKRKIPDIWIIATNIEPTGLPETGSYDRVKNLVNKFAPEVKVDIWGGRKILDYLLEYPHVAKSYGHFLTPGHVISCLYEMLNEKEKDKKSLIEHLIVNHFKELSYTKLEQAGSGIDTRPKIYELFRDLPIGTGNKHTCHILKSLVSASNNVQKISVWHEFGSGWRDWAKQPHRTRVILLKGGPGQGKSTVGQYFAQIQRAAFILSENGPIVTPQIKEIAIELKKVAEQDGFWPKIPRIPVFIELKDYANWYIGQGMQSPRNIIEYLCHKINCKTSFSVNAKLFRESFGLSTWFINFDGLDEVPNDLKDNIAEEITHFTNELMPTLDADILTLCSTRPQGYSGQFDDLDSCICNLLPLPEVTALSCAEAVIKFNRSEEESQQSIKILEAAMASKQVKELMTTPLQSHIMAVVVRDGGRPPEKRWELFNNFYSVMKKRESLKDFPDKRISALLREKEQLLKAIHDRLGICLHVKAESSEGAEASLNKSEFKELAEQATEILMDGDIKDTVDTLMEATIERLVFVNTPDSSEHVRFDIRQLQEFFAGEFIHNAFDDSEFQQRFEILCGDAHWREVVHFILSALVHYKKFSTLTICSKILQQLDEDDNYKIRTYKKRSAIGSLLTLRLIEEGILEQDKRIRNLFTKNLTSLWGVIDIEVLYRVNNIKMEQSRSWLINNMIDSFLELDYSESVACGYLFSLLLPETHERFHEVKERLKHAPDAYWILVLNIFEIEYAHSDTCRYQSWFLDLVVDMYFDKKTSWDLIKCLHGYFLRNKSAFSLAMSSMNSPDKYKSFLTAFLMEDFAPPFDKNNKDYCFVSMTPCSYDWSNTKVFPIDVDLFKDSTYSYPVELFKATCSLLESESADSLRKIIRLLGFMSYESRFVPIAILAMIPLRFDDIYLEKDCTYLYKCNEVTLENYLYDKKIKGGVVVPECRYITSNHKEYEKNLWGKLCLDYPDVALQLIQSPFFKMDEITFALENNTKEFLEPILKIALQYPESFSRYFFVYGDLFTAYPEHAQTLKNSLLRYPLVNNSVYPHRHIRVSSFMIDIHNEKNFIVSLAHSLATHKSLKVMRFTGPGASEEIDDLFLLNFGLNTTLLNNIVKDASEDSMVRASCLSLMLIKKASNKNSAVDEFYNSSLDAIFISLLNDSTVLMLITAIYHFLNNVTSVDKRSMEFLGNISNLTKNNRVSRELLESIFNRWRERAGHVVQTSGQLESWLRQ